MKRATYKDVKLGDKIIDIDGKDGLVVSVDDGFILISRENCLTDIKSFDEDVWIIDSDTGVHSGDGVYYIVIEGKVNWCGSAMDAVTTLFQLMKGIKDDVLNRDCI